MTIRDCMITGTDVRLPDPESCSFEVFDSYGMYLGNELTYEDVNLLYHILRHHKDLTHELKMGFASIARPLLLHMLDSGTRIAIDHLLTCPVDELDEECMWWVVFAIATELFKNVDQWDKTYLREVGNLELCFKRKGVAYNFLGDYTNQIITGIYHVKQIPYTELYLLSKDDEYNIIVDMFKGISIRVEDYYK